MAHSQNICRFPLTLEGRKVGEVSISRILLRRAIHRTLHALHGEWLTPAVVKDFEQFILELLFIEGPDSLDRYCGLAIAAILRRANGQDQQQGADRRTRVLELLESEVPDEKDTWLLDRLANAMHDKDGRGIDDFGRDLKRIVTVKRGNKAEARSAAALSAAKADCDRFRHQITAARRDAHDGGRLQIEKIITGEVHGAADWPVARRRRALEQIIKENEVINRIKPSILARRLAALKHPGISEAALR